MTTNFELAKNLWEPEDNVNLVFDKRKDLPLIRLAKRFKEDLAYQVTPEPPGFLCPFCNLFYVIDDMCRGYLSKAHIWPRSAGGKKWTVLCRHCNWLLGQKYDKYLSDYSNFEKQFTDGEFKKRLTFRKDDLSVDVLTVMRPDNSTEKRLSFEIQPGHHIPGSETILKQIFNGSGDITIEAKIDDNEWRKVALAKLLFSFLTMYQTFGYEFIFSRLGQSIKAALTEEIPFEGYYSASVTESTKTIPFQEVFLIPRNELSDGFAIRCPDNLFQSREAEIILMPDIHSAYFDLGSVPQNINISVFDKSVFEFERIENQGVLEKIFRGKVV